MITDSFDPRTFANMEVALERACKILGVGSEGHQARCHIAGKIVECAESGDGTLGGLTKAGRVAATDLCVMRGHELNRRSNLITGSRHAALAEVTLH